jgi:ribosomal protein S18 acetylase RimI-like enzyme
MNDDMSNVRMMCDDDVMEVVGIHLKSFQGFFLTFLGSRFLYELYAGILDDPSGMSFVSLDADRLTGFVAGSSEPAGFYRRLLRRRWWRFALASINPILKNPMVLPHLWRALRKPLEVQNQTNTGTLMSIAVGPEEQGIGLGQVLVKAFLEEASRRGLKSVDLTTDSLNNDHANQFYQRIGFECSKTYITPEGREMNEYVINL